MSTLRAGWRRKRGTVPGKGKTFCSPKRPQRLSSPPASYSIGSVFLSSGVKRLEREAPPPSSDEVKNEQGHASTAYMP